MTRNFLLAMMLASAMALGQSGSSSGAPAQQQPQRPSTQEQQQQPATQPGTEPGAETSTGQTAMTGCLKQSGGNWVLAADNGQTVNLSGDSSMLKQHDGRQVQVQGTQASDGSFQVSAVNVVSDSCASPR